MKRGLIVLVCSCLAIGAGYFSISKWAIRHETLNLFDAKRNRPVAVDLAVRRDYEIKADAGYWKLPVAIISHGNTVKNTEYSFLANVFAARGYLVASIQHDLPTDAPLMTKEGSLYVGRLKVYERGEANILFAIGELKKMQPNADYDHLTMVGHSNGGDISMFFAQQHPELVRRVVTLDNLRVPFVTDDKALKILSFRSHDPHFKTEAQHTDMSDRGPDSVK
jgi:dienelactone hydrolase